MREWIFAGNTSFDVLCVCPDQAVGKKSAEDEAMISTHDFSLPLMVTPQTGKKSRVTSELEEIKTLSKNDEENVVFSIYQSSPIIAEYQQKYIQIILFYQNEFDILKVLI